MFHGNGKKKKNQIAENWTHNVDCAKQNQHQSDTL